MQIVIDIPECVYKSISSGKFDIDGYFKQNLSDTFRNGTLLPKGHGRLIDADKAIYEINEMKVQGETSIMAVILAKVLIRGSKTVIEADDEEGEG